MILAQVQFAFGILLIMALLLLCGIASVVFLGVFAISKLRPGVIVLLAALMLLFLAANGGYLWLSVAREEPVAHKDQKQVQAEAATKRAVLRVGGSNGKSLDEAWEELNKPRIELSDEQPADGEAASAPGEEAPAAEDVAATEPDEVATDPPATAVADATPAEPRPEWIDVAPKRVGNTWREVLVTDEYATDEEVYDAANWQLIFATYNHFQRLMGRPVRPPSERLRPSRPFARDSDREGWQNAHRDYLAEFSEFYSFGIGIDFIRREIAKDEYLETVERSFGPMKKLYTLVEFTPAVDRELRNRWDAYRRQQRLTAVGMGAGGVLGLVGLAFALLQIDTATKGYYTKRLFLGVPAVIIGAVVSVLAWFEAIF